MNVTFDTLNVRKAVTTTTTPYSSGDQVGTPIQVDNMCTNEGGTGTLLSLSIVDATISGAQVDLDVFFFNQNPTVTSADNTAFSMTDANAASQYLGHVSFSSADYKVSALQSFISAKAIGLGLASTGTGRDVYAVVVSRGAPTYINGTGLELIFHINRD